MYPPATNHPLRGVFIAPDSHRTPPFPAGNSCQNDDCAWESCSFCLRMEFWRSTTRVVVARRLALSVHQLQVNQSAAERRDDCLGTVAYVEAHEDDTDMAFDRGLGDAQFGGDLLVAPAPDNQVEDLAFTGAEL